MRPDRDHAHPRDRGRIPTRPLAQGQVRHLVAGLREPLADAAVPALGATDGPGIQAVVDEADAHWSGPRLAGSGGWGRTRAPDLWDWCSPARDLRAARPLRSADESGNNLTADDDLRLLWTL